MGKDVILQLVNAVQHGVPEEDEVSHMAPLVSMPAPAITRQMTQQDNGDEDEEDEIDQDMMDVTHDAGGPTAEKVPGQAGDSAAAPEEVCVWGEKRHAHGVGL